MALAILVVGDMGTGKSTSLRNLPPSETVIISPNAKDLPWEGGMEDYSTDKKNFFLTGNLRTVEGKPGVEEIIRQANGIPKIKYLVIEDLTHYMNYRMMDDKFMKNQDWSKWNQFGADVFAGTVKDFAALRDDLTIIVIGHTELKEDGSVGMLTAGKLLDNTVKIPSWFTYVFHTRVFTDKDSTSYKFQTNRAGGFLAKSPMGVFKQLYIDNDIKVAIDEIRMFRTRKKLPDVTPDPTKLPETLK